MPIHIHVNQIDIKSAVIAKISIFDAHIVREKEFDYDDMEGVIDDWDNPYDLTVPITIDLRQIIVNYSKNHSPNLLV